MLTGPFNVGLEIGSAPGIPLGDKKGNGVTEGVSVVIDGAFATGTFTGMKVLVAGGKLGDGLKDDKLNFVGNAVTIVGSIAIKRGVGSEEKLGQGQLNVEGGIFKVGLLVFATQHGLLVDVGGVVIEAIGETGSFVGLPTGRGTDAGLLVIAEMIGLNDDCAFVGR